MVNIILPNEHNPYKLPKEIDFHAQTAGSYLDRETRHKLQIDFSKMTKAQLKTTIANFEQMEMEAISSPRLARNWEGVRDRLLKKQNYGEYLNSDMFNEIERFEITNALWCRSIRDFAEKYLNSLTKQKKI